MENLQNVNAVAPNPSLNLIQHTQISHTTKLLRPAHLVTLYLGVEFSDDIFSSEFPLQTAYEFEK